MRREMQEAATLQEAKQQLSEKKEYGMRLYEKWSKKKNLGEGMDKMMDKSADKALGLAIMLENQENHLQNLTETVISGSFSTTPENVIRIVRLGYPNSVRGEIFHEFPMITARDSIYYLKSTYAATARGSTIDDTTHESSAWRYASEIEEQTLGLGDVSTVEFTGTLANPPLRPFSVKILVNQQPVAVDDGSGNLTGSALNSSSTNSINYTTGAITINFAVASAPGDAETVIVQYHFDSEESTQYGDVRAINLQLTDYQFRARPWPLYVSWSKMSELLLGTTLDIDAEQALIKGAADELKKSLDFHAVRMGYRYSLGNTLTTFNTDFAASGSDSEKAHAQSVTRVLAQASKVIYNALQRGGVNTLVAGTEVAAYLTMHDQYTSDGSQPEIGIFRTGTLLGKPVYQAPNDIVPEDMMLGVWHNPNETGDVAMAFGSLIPLYQTQTLEYKNAYSETGLYHFGDFKALQTAYMIRLQFTNL